MKRRLFCRIIASPFVAHFRSASIVAGYALLAVLITWPLPRHFTTHLPGDPGGDTGTYVWNTWVFHDAVSRQRWPLATDRVLSLTGGADLTLHNYSTATNVLALPFVGPLGVVGAFNLAFLLGIALTAVATYALARRLGLSPGASWVAGALFAASPTLVAKGTAHSSLVHAAPLPVFLLALVNVLERQRRRDAIALGAAVAWAAYADAYYPIYCLLMGVVVVVTRGGTYNAERRPGAPARRARQLCAALALVGSASLVARGLLGPISLGTSLRVDSTHTIALASTLAAVGLMAAMWRVRVSIATLAWRRLMGLAALAAVVTVVLAGPLLASIVARWQTGDLAGETVFWRSSPRGVDVLAYVVPNPQHPVFGDVTRGWWLPKQADAYPEFVASFSLVALGAIGAAWWRGALPRPWVFFTATFVALSLGPFVHVAAANTTIPGPWAFLRYLPLVGEARSPSRLAIVAVLGLALLAAWALDAFRARGVRRWWLAAGAVSLALELVAVRPVFPVAATPVTQALADADAGDHAVLTLPAGLRDGRSSVGNFSPRLQFQQVFHGRRLVNGYLSRISDAERRGALAFPLMRALFELSEKRALGAELRQLAEADRDNFLRRTCLGFVVAQRDQTTPELRDFAIKMLGLTFVVSDEENDLYRAQAMDPCDAVTPDRAWPAGRAR